MKYKDYYNYESDNRDIWSHNDILGMTVSDLFKNELPLAYQYNTIGVPKDDELTSSHNTYQYTNANGQLRWRSGSKSTEELLEEEHRRNQEMQAQNESAQTPLVSSTAPETSVPKPQITDSPIIDSEPLFDDTSLRAMSGLIQKGKEKFLKQKNQGNDLIKESINDVVFSENPNQIDSSIMQEIEHILKPLSVKDDIDPVVDEASPYLLKGEITKETNKPGILGQIKDNLQNYLHDNSKLYRNYEGLTPLEAAQKWASKFMSPLTAREYYGLASELKDDGKPAKKRLRDNDFYKLADIHNEETKNLIQANMIKNLQLDPNDPDTYEKIKDIDVVIPKVHSHLYKLLKNSDELADFVANNYDDLVSNPNKRVDSWIEYARPRKSDIGHDFWDKTNRYAIYKKSDISAKMNEDGSMTILQPDFYDFDYMESKNESDSINKIITKANNTALGQQEKEQLKKYSLASILTLSPEEIQELLERERRIRNNK